MKRLKVFVSIALTIFILLSSSYDTMADTTSNVIFIKSAEDLLRFSKNCTLDSFSEDKIVQLTDDIDLSDIDFKIIPSFSGTFYGNNHTIRGFNTNSSGSDQGLFRYLQEEGIIKNLCVEGRVNPSGTKKEIGGIIGTNKGQIVNCSFNGEIRGTTSVGGIVGYNAKTGSIVNCQFYGLVIGEHYTGGIVGQNLGYIGKCINHSEVNTIDDAIPNNGMTSYNLKNIDIKHLNSTENIDAQTDTGGIVGYNQGIIKSSINHGSIGYNHVGYNIGGIVGRQSGYMSECKNYGIVNGRKDVGGVAGQAEPFISLLFSEDTLERINNELNELNQLTNKLVNDNDQSSEILSSRLENLNTLTNSASDKMEDLLNNTTDYVDESTSTVNTGMDRISHSMEQLEPVLDNFVNASDELTSGFNEIENGFNKLAVSSTDITNSISDLDNAFEDFSVALKKASTACEHMSESIDHIEEAIDSHKIICAIAEFESALDELKLVAEAGIRALKLISNAFDYIDNWQEFQENLQTELDTMLSHTKKVLPKIKKSLETFKDELHHDEKEVEETLECIDAAINNIDRLTHYIDNASKDIQEGLSDISSASENANVAMKNFSKGIDYFSNASNECSDGISNIKDILKELNEYEKLELPKLDDYVTESSDSLFDEINNISNELDLLNKESKNTSDTFNNNLRIINNQLKVIVDIIKEGLDALSFDNEDLFEDVSDQSLQEEPTIEKGIIRACSNNGTIYGDVNVGGIAGSMAIEYDFDPEDDIVNKGNETFNFKYQTKGLLISSINNGQIQAKKDYAGGIVGRMDSGLIITSENYGSIENLDGDYTGGIAGSSNSVIRKCYSLSELSGKNYVGGIAGYACDVYDCLALITINESNEFTGAIAGDISGKFENNYFVKDEIDGIDGISYGGKAIPQSYDDFILHEDLPKSFKSFQLTFVVDDNIIKIIPFKYGDSIDLDKLPEIPKKEGYYSSWPDYNYNHLVFSKKLEAIYTPNIPVLSSNPDSSHPKLLVEGSFKPDDRLIMNEVNSSNKKIDNYAKMKEWSVQLNTVLDKPLTFRFLKPDSNKEIILYQKKNNKWEQLKTTIDGSYLLFESDLSSFNLAVVEKDNIFITYFVSGCLLIAIMLFLIHKKKKSKKIKS